MTTKNISENVSGMLVAGAAVIFVGYSVKTFFLSTSKSKLEYPPGPKQHWLFGNWNMLPDRTKGETMDTVYLETTKQFGLVFSMNLPGVLGQTIVVADPELARKIMVNRNPPKSAVYKLVVEPLLGPNNIISLQDVNEWAQKRKVFNAGFTPTFLKKMVTTMAAKLQPFVDGIESDMEAGVPTHMLDRAQNFTSDVILAIALGEDWNGKEKHPARYHFDNLVQIYSGLLRNPLRMLFDVKAKMDARYYGKCAEQEMRKILEKRIAERTDSSSDMEDSSKDICSLAITNMMKKGEKDKDGAPILSEKDKCDIIDQLKSFYFAGHDTTAIAISWCIWLLSQHPRVISKLRTELTEMNIWTNPSIPPTFDELQKCKYLEAVIKETLRLYPPAGGISRSGRDLTDMTYKGYSLAACTIEIQIYSMQNSLLLWKEPQVFRPERFLDGSEQDLNLKFFAFSRGPRDCIGKHFAMLEAKLAISALLMKYDFNCVDPNEKMDTKLTNVPENGCLVKVAQRGKSK